MGLNSHALSPSWPVIGKSGLLIGLSSAVLRVPYRCPVWAGRWIIGLLACHPKLLSGAKGGPFEAHVHGEAVFHEEPEGWVVGAGFEALELAAGGAEGGGQGCDGDALGFSAGFEDMDERVSALRSSLERSRGGGC